MPSTTSKYKLPYPLLEDANNPPADFRALAETIETNLTNIDESFNDKLEEINATTTSNITTAKNSVATGIYVDGKWYRSSGINTFDNLGGWTLSGGGVYSYRKLQASVPIEIPSGWALKYEVVFSNHICLIAGGDMWNNDAQNKKSDAYILRLWNSTDAEPKLILRWELYKKS